jgi:hypothetical protein
LLCITFTSARGQVILFDLEGRRLVSHWTLPAAAGGYSDASGVAMDEHFHLFVADTVAGQVRHFSAFGRHLGDLGAPPAGSGQAHKDRAGVLDRPHAVALLDDVVLVACGDGRLRAGVQRLRRDGEVLRPLRPQGDSEGWFGAPRGLWADAHGVLVADTLHGQVLRYKPDGTWISAVATAGRKGDSSRPVAVARLPGGDLLILDAGDRPGARLFHPDGRQRHLHGAMDAIDRGQALALDAQGRVYVLDRHGERVLRFGPDLAFETVLVDLAEHLDDLGTHAP